MNDDIPDAALKLIGVEKRQEYLVTKKDIKRFAQAIGDPNPLYYDEEYAKTTRFKSIVAPPLFGQTFGFEDVSPEQLLPDGSPVEAAVPIPAKKLMGEEACLKISPGSNPVTKWLLYPKLKIFIPNRAKTAVCILLSMKPAFTTKGMNWQPKR